MLCPAMCTSTCPWKRHEMDMGINIDMNMNMNMNVHMNVNMNIKMQMHIIICIYIYVNICMCNTQTWTRNIQTNEYSPTEGNPECVRQERGRCTQRTPSCKVSTFPQWGPLHPILFSLGVTVECVYWTEPKATCRPHRNPAKCVQ
jgi:hypothetical protein